MPHPSQPFPRRSREDLERKARLTVSYEVEEQILHVEALMRAARASAAIYAPATIALFLTRAVRPEIGCDEISEGHLEAHLDLEVATRASEALLSMYKAGKERKSFVPTLEQAHAIVACLKPDVRRAKIVLDNLAPESDRPTVSIKKLAHRSAKQPKTPPRGAPQGEPF